MARIVWAAVIAVVLAVVMLLLVALGDPQLETVLALGLAAVVAALLAMRES